jgi:hypothetical protein
LGGYRTAFDPRPALQNLESNVRVKEAWQELWEGLHHQGDVGPTTGPEPEGSKVVEGRLLRSNSRARQNCYYRGPSNEEVRGNQSILSILALARNAPTHARFLLNYSNEELLDLENQAQGSDS